MLAYVALTPHAFISDDFWLRVVLVYSNHNLLLFAHNDSNRIMWRYDPDRYCFFKFKSIGISDQLGDFSA
jgi:hypothetical protein